MISKYLQITQLCIAVINFTFSTATLGTAAHTLQVYNSQHYNNDWWLPLWPDHFNVHGTKSLIGASVCIMLLNGLYFILCLVPRFNATARPTFRALIALTIALPACFIALSTIIYAHILNANSPEIDTIQTWTCRFRNAGSLPFSGNASGSSNKLFSSLCTESKFSLYGILVVFIFQTLMVPIAIVGFLADKWKQLREKTSNESGSGNLEMGIEVEKPNEGLGVQGFRY